MDVLCLIVSQTNHCICSLQTAGTVRKQACLTERQSLLYIHLATCAAIIDVARAVSNDVTIQLSVGRWQSLVWLFVFVIFFLCLPFFTSIYLSLFSSTLSHLATVAKNVG